MTPEQQKNLVFLLEDLADTEQFAEENPVDADAARAAFRARHGLAPDFNIWKLIRNTGIKIGMIPLPTP